MQAPPKRVVSNMRLFGKPTDEMTGGVIKKVFSRFYAKGFVGHHENVC